MYSVVLLMALSGGAEAPDCHKSCSCSGYCSGSYCSGYACTGSYCSGYACSGSCHGGGHKLFGGHGGGLFGGHKHSCSGSYCSGYSCSGYMGCTGCAGGMIYGPGMGGSKSKPLPPPKKDEVTAPATIVLSLPADAKVSIDGTVTTSTSATRTFVTPELNQDQAFVYTISAQIVRDGQTLTVSEKVTVRAGEETRVNFGTAQFTALTVATK